MQVEHYDDVALAGHRVRLFSIAREVVVSPEHLWLRRPSLKDRGTGRVRKSLRGRRDYATHWASSLRGKCHVKGYMGGFQWVIMDSPEVDQNTSRTLWCRMRSLDTKLFGKPHDYVMLLCRAGSVVRRPAGYGELTDTLFAH